MKGPISSTNQTKLVCKTSLHHQEISWKSQHTANDVTTSLQYRRQCKFPPHLYSFHSTGIGIAIIITYDNGEMNFDWESMTLPERKHALPRVTENEQVKIPTRGIKVQCGTMNGDIKAWHRCFEKSDGSCTIQGFLTKKKAKVKNSQDVQRKITKLEFEEFEGSNIVPVIGCM